MGHEKVNGRGRKRLTHHGYIHAATQNELPTFFEHRVCAIKDQSQREDTQ